MQVHKIIFRLDFPANFSIIDSVGKILNIFQDDTDQNGKATWLKLGENSQNRSVIASTFSSKENVYQTITIEPVSIIAHIEVLSGVKIDRVHEFRAFRVIESTANRLREEFGLTEFSRIGLRLICVSDAEEVQEDPNEALLGHVSSNIKKPVSDILGNIQDCGVAFNGSDEDKINFHLQFGPHKKDVEPHLKNIVDSDEKEIQLSMLTSFNQLFFDLDLYEENLEISTTTRFSKWCSPLFNKATSCLNKIKSLDSI